ncbi:hypothetical protein [Leucobacter sp. GX24907]
MTITAMGSKKFSALKLGLATAAAAALAFGSMTPAYAADYQLGPDDVAGFEIGGNGSEDGFNYDQWHVGNVDTPGTETSASLLFNECSVTTLAPVERTVTQVLKGFPVDGRPDTLEEASALIDSLSVEVVDGSVTLQLPVFLYEEDENGRETRTFTTVRNVDGFGAGTGTWSDDTPLLDSTGLGGGNKTLLIEFLGELDRFEILGVGFTGATGTEVESLSFGGDTFTFGTGDCLPEEEIDETPGDDNPEEDPELSDGNTDAPIGPRKPARVETGL